MLAYVASKPMPTERKSEYNMKGRFRCHHKLQ